MPNAQSLRSALLTWIADQETPHSPFVRTRPFLDEHGLDNRAGDELLRGLIHDHFAEAAPTTYEEQDHLTEARLTPAGLREVELLRAQRQDPAAQQRHLRRELLLWLYGQALIGQHTPRLADFTTTDGAWFAGAPVPTTAVENASLALREAGMISGPGTWGHGVPRPRLTAAGTARAEDSGGDVSQHRQGPRDSVGQQINFNAPMDGNNFAMGTNVTQTNTVNNLDARAMSAFARGLQSALPDLRLPPQDEAQARQALQQIQAEADSPTPDPERIRTRMERVMEFFSQASVPVVTYALMQGVTGRDHVTRSDPTHDETRPRRRPNGRPALFRDRLRNRAVLPVGPSFGPSRGASPAPSRGPSRLEPTGHPRALVPVGA
ncbi:hypothetical protein [Streptomyces sp. SID3343]|uniref:hypothetical protein n=1 Tax=Streptomyces sp. SID3343 TaxID=2690260 RepID=UPI001367CCC8|nr:hypothetical protein [Streptomyces sp. SID3343]MYW02032.1 hypothetical protein [Streptomyces sp. SID3343]